MKMRNSGFAILSVLVFVALLSVLVTSFLVFTRVDRASTQNYSQAAKAQELALNGLQEITSDLLMEIEAGSLADGTPAGAEYTQHGLRVYVPTDRRAAVPARIGFEAGDYSIDISEDKLPGTLLRVSRGGPSLQYPSFMDPDKLPPNRASLVSSEEKSGNGRWITPEKWNKPLLLGSTAPTPFQKRPPDWIYVTRNGSRVCSDDDLEKHKQSGDLSNPDQVLGRYAFTIYDEGGLLDMNAAGFPSDVVSTAEGTIAAGGKTAVSYADLTQLPGLSGKQAELDAMVRWRNKGSIAEEGDFIKMVPSLLRDGFLKFRAQDSPLMGRQDLIGYFKKMVGTTEPLPFLGTFSRAQNVPTWGPTMNSSEMPGYLNPPLPGTSPEDYKDNADKEGSVNRKLANLRSRVTRRRYKDDGTLDSETIEPGESLVARRFSLAKLAWLTPHGPLAGIPDQAVYDCFGLRWVSGQGEMAGYWEYAAASSEGELHIRTLDDLLDESREPNFFELLKAGILSGSLGKDPGARSDAFGQLPTDGGSTEGPAGFHFGSSDPANPGFSQDKDRHALQIGANIIDQSDRDSYPTAIFFDSHEFPEGTPAEKARVYCTLYGVENLPYMTRIFLLLGGYPTSDEWDPRGTLNTWLQPEIWNPHQAPALGTPAPPTSFRVRTYGAAQADYYLTWGSEKLPTKVQGAPRETGLTVKYDSTHKEAGIIYFRADAGKDSFFYQKPKVLPKSQIDVKKTASTNYFDSKGIDPDYPSNNPLPDPDLYQFAAAWAGNVFLPPDPWIPDPTAPKSAQKGKNFWNATGTGVLNDWHLRLNCTPFQMTMSLECWDETADAWRPYCFVSRLEVALGSNSYDGNRKSPRIPAAPAWFGLTSVSNPDRMLDFGQFSRPDPRTDRFSVGYAASNTGPDVGIKFAANRSMEPGDGRAYGMQSRHPRKANGFLSKTNKSSDHILVGAWAENNKHASPFPGNYSVYNCYYADPDGVVRPGDGIYRNISTGDGCPLYDTAQKAGSADARRPVILNRPFQSVGELGYVYRDLPFKTLDLFTPDSADAALLDLFALTDQPIMAGQVNLNSAPKEVITAILAGTLQNAVASPVVSLSREDAESVATKIATAIAADPISNPADLVSQLSPVISAGYTASEADAAIVSANKGNKSYTEGPVRALSAVTNTRTWNLLIDVIAQSGKIPFNAKTGLKEFLVEGEKRYWLHLAIDRYSGKILGTQLEPVYD